MPNIYSKAENVLVNGEPLAFILAHYRSIRILIDCAKRARAQDYTDKTLFDWDCSRHPKPCDLNAEVEIIVE